MLQAKVIGHVKIIETPGGRKKKVESLEGGLSKRARIIIKNT